MARKRTILLIDDDPGQLALLTAQLERRGAFATEAFGNAADALERILVEPPDGVVCDLRMPGIDGLEVTRRLRESHPGLPVIIATGAGSEEDATACLEAGAAEFGTKPVDPATLLARVRKALDERPARALLEETARTRFDPHGIIGDHPRVRAIRDFVDAVAAAPRASVLLLGESGTGKNLVARAIHTASTAGSFRFVEVNCAGLPANLLEAELFGYERGAFTDARQTKRGLVEEADGGTLFLDEIGSMPLELQAKLLTFLESRAFRRIGATDERSVDLRVIAATNADLAQDVRLGTFREDLFYRLNVASSTLPPLREIRSDIGTLARHFTARAAEYFRKPEPALEEEGIRVLEEHDWPGNARELRNAVERALIFASGPTLRFRPEMIGGAGTGSAAGGGLRGAPAAPVDGGGTGPSAAPGSPVASPDTGGGPSSNGPPLTLPGGLSLEEVERRYVEHTLAAAGGRVGEAARRLGLSRKAFWSLRKRLGLL